MPVIKQKLYLDTSVVSALYDKRAPERKTLTEQFWKTLNSYEIFISDLVKEEIEEATEEIRHKMLKSVDKFILLKSNQEAEALAQQYIDFRVFPGKYFDDSLHVAVAVINNTDFVVSWNFKHLVKVRTRKMVNLVNEMLGYPNIEIVAPPEL